MYFVTKGDLPISFPHSPDCLEAYFSGQGVSTIVFFAAEQDGGVRFRKKIYFGVVMGLLKSTK